jgi:hypothetical protein
VSAADTTYVYDPSGTHDLYKIEPLTVGPTVFAIHVTSFVRAAEDPRTIVNRCGE